MSDLTWRAPATEVRPSPIHGRGLFARRAIGRGEIVAVKGGHVLTRSIDWATTDDGDYTLACRCGSSRCRGPVTGKDWMKPELQARYRGWFCWFLPQEIDAMSGATT